MSSSPISPGKQSRSCPPIAFSFASEDWRLRAFLFRKRLTSRTCSDCAEGSGSKTEHSDKPGTIQLRPFTHPVYQPARPLFVIGACSAFSLSGIHKSQDR